MAKVTTNKNIELSNNDINDAIAAYLKKKKLIKNEADIHQIIQLSSSEYFENLELSVITVPVSQ